MVDLQAVRSEMRNSLPIFAFVWHRRFYSHWLRAAMIDPHLLFPKCPSALSCFINLRMLFDNCWSTSLERHSRWLSGFVMRWLLGDGRTLDTRIQPRHHSSAPRPTSLRACISLHNGAFKHLRRFDLLSSRYVQRLSLRQHVSRSP